MTIAQTTDRKTARRVALTIAGLCTATIFGFLAGHTHARTQDVTANLLLKTGQTVAGQTITYPQYAPAQITAAIVTIKPGAQIGWHTHDIPLFGYILDGEISVDYGNNGIRLYRQGDALMEALKLPHKATNLGTKPAVLLSVFVGAQGVPISRPAKNPYGHPTP